MVRLQTPESLASFEASVIPRFAHDLTWHAHRRPEQSMTLAGKTPVQRKKLDYRTVEARGSIPLTSTRRLHRTTDSSHDWTNVARRTDCCEAQGSLNICFGRVGTRWRIHRPVAFDMTDQADIADFIDAAGPADLVTMSREGLSASVVPLILDRSTNSLIGHLARPNPQWRSAGATASASSARTAALPTSTR